MLSLLPELVPELSGDRAGDRARSTGDRARSAGGGARSAGDGARSAGDGAWGEEAGGGATISTLACSCEPDALASSGAQRRLLLPSSAEIAISAGELQAELRRDLEPELRDCDLVFISAALGEGAAADGCGLGEVASGLGSGAAAVATAAAGRAAGALVVAGVMEPIGFEGGDRTSGDPTSGDCTSGDPTSGDRTEVAQAALRELQAVVG